jgi:DNA polymerase III subunit delta'
MTNVDAGDMLDPDAGIDVSTPSSQPGTIWNDVVGQSHAIGQLRAALDRGAAHAYLFVGPAGCTKFEAARAFAGRIISGSEDRDQRDARLALEGVHPDIKEVQRSGASISFDQAREIVRVAAMAPSESSRKVLILDEFHLLNPTGAGLMLKTIEEPPDSTTFIILCEFVPHDLITISSRCTRVDFRAISADVIAARLLTEGIGPVEAQAASKASLGDLDRARLLATDPTLAERRKLFLSIAGQLDGSGTVAMRLAGELLAAVDASADAIKARHENEIAELDARIKEFGERGSGKKQLEDRHKREVRRARTDELRAGLTTMAQTYRDSLTQGTARNIDAAAGSVHAIHDALESLERNPNEKLLLENLLWSLPSAV